MRPKTKTQEAIERAHEARQGHGFRNHLGASIIGRECPRQIWYIFRWATRVRHAARKLRIFERGNDEEAKLVSLLRKAGIHVLDRDPDTGKQFRVGDFDDHFGGSLDSLIYDSPEYPNLWVLGEFKTHNDQSFNKLVKDGLIKSKYEHFVQMQLYMGYQNLPAGLYFAVNKDNDEIEVKPVEFDPTVASRFRERAGKIIYAMFPPERIPNASEGWYICNFCDYKGVCLQGDRKAMSCRTCIHSRPIQEGKWFCERYQIPLTEADQRRGCTNHQEIPEG